MANLSGTVLVGGAPPTHDFEVQAYASPPPMTDYYGGVAIYDFAGEDDVSTIDGSYTITGLDAGMTYHVVALHLDDDETPDIKASYYNGGDPGASTTFNDSTLTLPMAGIDIDATAADGTGIGGTSINCPVGTEYVITFIIEVLDLMSVAVLIGLPNALLDGVATIGNDLYAAGEYRVLAFALDHDTNPILTMWYDGVAPDFDGAADIVGGNSVVVVDFSKAPRASQSKKFYVAPGAGAHFARPKPSKRRLLR